MKNFQTNITWLSYFWYWQEASNDEIIIKKSYVIHLDRLIHQACFNEANNKEVIIVNEDGGICICYGRIIPLPWFSRFPDNE